MNLIAAPTQFVTAHLRTALAVAAAGALVVSAVVFGAMWVDASSDKDSLEHQLTETQTRATGLESDLEETRSELDQTKQALEKIEGDLENTEGNLKFALQDLDALRLDLGVSQGALIGSRQETATTRDQLSQTQGQLSAVQADVEAARAELIDLDGQLASAQGSLASVQSEAQLCKTGGQDFVNALNNLIAVFNRWRNGQATTAEVDAADAKTDAAYNAFIAKCKLQP